MNEVHDAWGPNLQKLLHGVPVCFRLRHTVSVLDALGVECRDAGVPACHQLRKRDKDGHPPFSLLTGATCAKGTSHGHALVRSAYK